MTHDENPTDQNSPPGGGMSRRKAMALISGGIAALWTGAVAALAGVIGTAPLRRASGTKTMSLGKKMLFTETFRGVDVDIPIRDGWYERDKRLRVYAKLDDSGSPYVLSGTCTHLGCTVRWNREANQFQCPCHGGKFSPDGAVIEGPPPAPLNQLPAEVRDGEIFVKLT